MNKVVFSKQAEKVYQQLKKSKLKEDQILIKTIDAKVNLIKIDAQIGTKVKKKQIPKSLRVKNLFRIALPCYWRMLYTIENNQPEIIAFIIELKNHKKYDRTMNY